MRFTIGLNEMGGGLALVIWTRAALVEWLGKSLIRMVMREKRRRRIGDTEYNKFWSFA